MKPPLRIPQYLVPLLIDGAKTVGWEELYNYILEQVQIKDVEYVQSFTKWLIDNNKTFGWNVGEVWKEWAMSQRTSAIANDILKIAAWWGTEEWKKLLLKALAKEAIVVTPEVVKRVDEFVAKQLELFLAEKFWNMFFK